MTERRPKRVSSVPPPPLDLAPVVLLADDNRTVREILKEALEQEGCRVLAAVDGQEALALAQSWVPDLVVTDVTMPRLNGFGLIRAVRLLYPGVPVIVVTGETSYQGRTVTAVAAEHGVMATLLKPFDLSDFHQAARTAVPLEKAS